MDSVPKHDLHEAAGRPLRRARTWAWTVFWITAGSSVLYNSYHALVRDHMPWYTGLPEGFLPLAVAIGVLEYASAWRGNRLMQAACWSVTAGAMAWSALMINSVLHDGWAFGLIGDAAALSAMYFLLNGPTAAQAATEVEQRISELTAERDAERLARQEAETAGRAALSDLKARADAEIGRLRTSRETDLSAFRDRFAEEMAAARSAHETTRQDLETARGELAQALTRTEALTAKLAAVSAQKKRAKVPASARTGSGDNDPTNELRAVMELRANSKLLQPRMSGELARALDLSPATGRRLHTKLVAGGALTEYAQSLIEPSGERSQ